jgi:hypothetical protein
MPPDEPVATPQVTRDWCPKCEPKVDQTKHLVQVAWCFRHSPSLAGDLDASVKETVGTGGNRPGAVNRLMCEVIHRPKKSAKKGTAKRRRSRKGVGK